MPPIAASAASRTFSCTLSSGKTLDTWNVLPSPSRVRKRDRLLRDVTPAEVDRAGRRAIEPRQEIEERRLAGAVRPDDPEQLALGNLEADIGDDFRAADVEPEVARGEDRRVHASAFCVRSYLNGVIAGWTLPAETVLRTLTA